MQDAFAQVLIFDRIVRYLSFVDLEQFVLVNQAVYQIFHAPCYYRSRLIICNKYQRQRVFAQVPIFDRIIRYLDVPDLACFLLINRDVFRTFQSLHYKSRLIPIFRSYIDHLRICRELENEERYRRSRPVNWGSGIFTLIAYSSVDMMIMGNRPIKPKNPPKPLKQLSLNESKDNAKYNRIMQNKMYKKHNKR